MKRSLTTFDVMLEVLNKTLKLSRYNENNLKTGDECSVYMNKPLMVQLTTGNFCYSGNVERVYVKQVDSSLHVAANAVWLYVEIKRENGTIENILLRPDWIVLEYNSLVDINNRLSEIIKKGESKP